MTISEEIQRFLVRQKREHLDAGEDPTEIVGEQAAHLLILAHYLALKIGIDRDEIINNLDHICRNLGRESN